MKVAHEVKAIQDKFQSLSSIDSTKPANIADWATRAYLTAVRDIPHKNAGTALWMVATALHSEVDIMKQEMMRAPDKLKNSVA